MKPPDPPTTATVEADLQWAPAPGREDRPIYDCWNRIGVGGNGSCGELPRYIHCRNCPVHAAAAAQMLDRPLLQQWRDEWTDHYARQETRIIPHSGTRTSVVIFRVGAEWLALPTEAFQEVAEGRNLHSLPHRRHGVVLGLVNIRGELLICASLERLLGLAFAEPKPLSGAGLEATAQRRLEKQSPVQSPKSKVQGTGDFRLETLDPRLAKRLLVSHWAGQRQVFPVDEVPGIHRVQNGELREPPVPRSDRGNKPRTYTRSVFTWREHTVGLLDAENLFTNLNQRIGQLTPAPTPALAARAGTQP